MAGAVRQPIDVQSLELYISRNVPEVRCPVSIKQFGYGQSNPTYQLTAKDGQKFVMRKKPSGILLSKTAHKVEREYRVIHALERTDVPVPKTYCLCEDDAIVGTPFYIMEFLDGRIIEDPAIPDVSPEDRTEMSVLTHPLTARNKLTFFINRWHSAIRMLAKLHRINPEDVGLENFGKSSGFYRRQIATFENISDAQARTEDIETHKPVGRIFHFDDMVSYFKKQQPKDRGTPIHGDYKIDNLVFHKTEPRVIGILDWEMATIGHPLSDLANLTNPWMLAPSPQGSRGNLAFSPGATRGLPSVEQVLEWYAEVAGWDPAPDMTWGAAFGMFRSCIIMQGIVARYARRQASSANAAMYMDMMQPFSERTWALIEREMSSSERPSKL